MHPGAAAAPSYGGGTNPDYVRGALAAPGTQAFQGPNLWTGPSLYPKTGPGSELRPAPRHSAAAPQSATSVADTADLAKAAGTGRTVATQYGTGSSRIAQKGEAQGPLISDAKTTANSGPQHADAKDYTLKQGVNGLVPSLDAQAEILKAHPEIGVAGSPEHAEFVKQWGEQTKNNKVGDTFANHMDVAKSAVQAGPSGDQPDATPEQSTAGQPFVPDTRSAAMKAGQAVAAAPGNIVNSVAQGIKSVGQPILQGASDFASGLTGSKAPGQYVAPGATDTAPPVVPGGTQSPSQIAQNSARAGLTSQTAQTVPAPSYQPDSDHADIHAQAMKAIGQATSAAHDAMNASPLQQGMDAIRPYLGNGGDTSPLQMGLDALRPYAGNAGGTATQAPMYKPANDAVSSTGQQMTGL